jgi:hypothetical protein
MVSQATPFNLRACETNIHATESNDDLYLAYLAHNYNNSVSDSTSLYSNIKWLLLPSMIINSTRHDVVLKCACACARHARVQHTCMGKSIILLVWDIIWKHESESCRVEASPAEPQVSNLECDQARTLPKSIAIKVFTSDGF